ncbi:hypothetical protein C0Q70_05948 [Pomacea canaliculata]|uniref:C2H2-type domain-containing protein n=1 Tax=Pomacea canaliculata TaxID=400727 RepID=A0A2T7PMM4_POMCA|nr:hypothetical protein C0Q70_05948 [Pomacea canaliculata]
MMGVPVVHVPPGDVGSSALAASFQPAHPSAAKLTEDQVPSSREDTEKATSAQELNLARKCLTLSSETFQQVGGSLAPQSTQLLQPAVHLLPQGAFLNLPNTVRTNMASPGLQLPFINSMNHNTKLSSALPLMVNGSQTCRVKTPSLTQLQISRAQSNSGSLLLAEATQGPEGDSSSSQKHSHDTQHDVLSSKHNLDCLPSQSQNAQMSPIQDNDNIVTSADRSVITVSSQQNHVALVPLFSQFLPPVTISAGSERHTQHPLTQIQEKYEKPKVISKKVSASKIKKNHSKENYMRTLLTTSVEKMSVSLDSDPVNGEHNNADTISVTLPSQMHADVKAHKPMGTGQTHEKNAVDMAANNYGVDGDDNEIVWLNKVVKVKPYCEIKNTAPCTCHCPNFNIRNFSGAVGSTCKVAANIAVEGDDDIIWVNRTIRGKPSCDFHSTKCSFRMQNPPGVIVLDDDDDNDVEILSAESVRPVPLPLSSDNHTATSKDSHIKIHSKSESLQGIPSAVLEVPFSEETSSVKQEGTKSKSYLISSDHTAGAYDVVPDNSPQYRSIHSETENIQKQPPSAIPQIDSGANTCVARQQEKQLAGDCSDHVTQHLEPIYNQMIDASFPLNVQASILQPGGGSGKDYVSTCDAGDFVTPSATAGTSHLLEGSLPNSQLHSSFSDNDNLGFFISEVKTVTPDFNPLHELSSEGFYVCGCMLGECNFSTQFASIFEMHLQKSHAKSKIFTCVHCGKLEESNKEAVDHLQKHLDQSRDMIHCTQTNCRYSCISPEEFLGHTVLTHQDLPHPICWNCHMTFTSLSQLVAHVKYNLLQMVHCVYCEAADTSIERILKHVDKNHAMGKRKYAVKKVLLCLERASNHCKNDAVLAAAENDSSIISEKQEGHLNASGEVPNVLGKEKLLKTRENEPAENEPDSLNESDNIVDCETSVFETVWIKEGSHQLENCIKNTIMEMQSPMVEHELKEAHRDIQKSSKLSSKSLSSNKKQQTNKQEFSDKIQQKCDSITFGPKVTPPSRKQEAKKKYYQKNDMLTPSPMLTPSHEKQKQTPSTKQKQKTKGQEMEGNKIQKGGELCSRSSRSYEKQELKVQTIAVKKVDQHSGFDAPNMSHSCKTVLEQNREVQRYECTICQQYFAKKANHMQHIHALVPLNPSLLAENLSEKHFSTDMRQKTAKYPFTRKRLAQEQEHSPSKQTLLASMKSEGGAPKITLSSSLSQLPFKQLRSHSESSQTDSELSDQTVCSSENSTSPSKEISTDSAHSQETHDLKVEGTKKESKECIQHCDVKQHLDISSSSCRKRSGVVEKDAKSSHSKHRRPNQTVHQKDSCGSKQSTQMDTEQPGSYNSKPKAFVKLKNHEKQKVLLSWLVSMSITKKALHEDYIINEDDIHLTLEDIPHSCLDDSVNLSLVQHFFTADAWKLIYALIEIKKEEPWLCKCCERTLKKKSVGCDSCLCWYHFQCAGLCKQPKEEFWFCKSCESGKCVPFQP